MTDPHLLSVTEVAARLGITRQAVLLRIKSGSLPAHRIGRMWAIPATAIEEKKEGLMDKHKIAVVVFMEVDAVDEQDAGNVGTSMLSDMIRAHGHHRTLTMRDNTWEGDIHKVMELGMAAGNGYLWTKTTSKAWQEYGYDHYAQKEGS